MIRLTATNATLEVEAATVSSLHCSAAIDRLTATDLAAESANLVVSSAGVTTLVPAPVASEQKQVRALTIYNGGAASNTVTVRVNIGGTVYRQKSADLHPGETLEYRSNEGWACFDKAGRLKTVAADASGANGKAINFYKVGTATEAAAVWYSFGKDTGFPGAWSPGTPGLSGRATNGTQAADAGCMPLPTAAGSLFVTDLRAATSANATVQIFDVLWVNSGVVVTTTTAQTINSVALPARDLNGGTSGHGVLAAILVTTATTNAAAIANTTLTYTNTDGVAGRTATMASFPATAVIGTVVFFQLAAGDKGVQSIQGITLGTTYTAGAISLMLVRPATTQAPSISFMSVPAQSTDTTGAKLHPGACLIPFVLPTATTAITMNGAFLVTDR